jgi:hypothetical protein
MAGMDTQHFPGRISQKFGNAFPTAWELSRGIVFARPADQVQPPSRNGIPQSGYSARTMLGIEAKIDESVSYPGMTKLCSLEEQSYVHLTTYAYHQDRR